MFHTQAKQFEEALMNLINNSGLKVSEAYYIVENAALQLKLAYEQVVLNEIKMQNMTEKHEEEISADQLNNIEQKENNNEQSETNASTDSGSVNVN